MNSLFYEGLKLMRSIFNYSEFARGVLSSKNHGYYRASFAVGLLDGSFWSNNFKICLASREKSLS